MLEIDGFEADDILGTVSKKAEEEGIKPYIITGDKDAFQLASDKTTVIFTKRGTSEFDAYDEKAVYEKYGFSPQQFIDFKGLMGDQSDNIPGIPGVGEKTATKLILEYGSVENLIASTDSMKKSKLREKIEENAQLAVMSKRLATICRDIPVEVDFEAMKYEEPDYGKLIEIYKKLEFNLFIKRLTSERKLAGLPADENTAEISDSTSMPASNDSVSSADIQKASEYDGDIPYSDITAINAANVETVHTDGADELKKAIEELKGADRIWLKVFHDNAHVKKPEISSVCMLACGGAENKAGRLYVIHWNESAPGALAEFFGHWRGRLCGHDIKDSYYALFSNGAAKLPDPRGYVFETYCDTAISAYLIDPQKKSYELSALMLEAYHKDFPTDKQIAEEACTIDMFGNAWDTQARLALSIFEASSSLVKEQAAQLARYGLVKVLTEAELPLVEVLASMESCGVRADREVLNTIGDSLKERIEKLTSDIYVLAGEEFNINSPKQLGVILFEKLGLPNGKKTKTGYSTSADILEKIADAHPAVPLILEYRMLTKLNGTYVEGMLPLIDENGKIHAHFQQTVTATGRLSCTEPNLQNIPVRQDIGRQFRRVFTKSHEDGVLVGADYSQVELRVMAHLSGDKALIDSFEQQSDIHTITASRVFGVPVEDVTPLQRSRAKAVNFGVIYGISAFGLSEDLKISRKEAQEYIDDYFKAHPGVKAYMDSMVEFCREHNYVSTLLGRRRYISEIHASNFMTRQLGERLAMNTPVQGTAADIMKLAMIRAYRALNEQNCESRLILQVHDELMIDCVSGEEEKVKELLEVSMTDAVQLKVVLAADVNTGNSWYDLK